MKSLRCPDHPAYRGNTKPRVSQRHPAGCTKCAVLFSITQEIASDDLWAHKTLTDQGNLQIGIGGIEITGTRVFNDYYDDYGSGEVSIDMSELASLLPMLTRLAALQQDGLTAGLILV